MSRVLRYEIPVDGEVHTRTVPGGLLHVAARQPDLVEFWVQDEGKAMVRQYTVVGTGYPWPDGAIHLGAAIVPGVRLVWHLLAVPT